MRNAGGAVPARHILGNYELFEEIGRGGMGIVYRALDLSLDRVVAIKVLRDDLRAHRSIVTRFSREAQAAARLDHPNIVQIYAVGTVDRTPFIAMEFIDALPLSAIMQREHRLEWKAALAIARQIAAALACAHDSHVVHRDIKPPNILLDENHHAYVTDFGIAKILTLDDNLTVDGTRLGTPHYMAPERCKTGEVTASSDLYSLGVLMFQLLTGRLPYEASTQVEMVQRIVAGPAARVRQFVPDVPEDVERLVAWLMEPNPKHRPADGHMVVDAIDRVTAGKPLDEELRSTGVIDEFRRSISKDAPVKTGADATPPPVWKRRGLVLSAAGILVALAVVAGLLLPDRAAPTSLSTEDATSWFANQPVAVFSDEGDRARMAALSLSGYSVAGISASDGDGALVLLEEQDGSRRAILSLAPEESKAEFIRIFETPSPVALLGAVATSYGPFALMHYAGDATLAPADGRAYGAVRVPATSMAAMHPFEAQWLGAITDGGMPSGLMRYAVAGAEILGEEVVPAGGAILSAQFSPDGGTILFLRQEPGTRVLYTLSTGGNPVEVYRGAISIGPGAMNEDNTAILVTDESGATPLLVAVAPSTRAATPYGPAWRGAWATPGSVILTAPDKKGAVQLWSMEAEPTAPRTQLTFVDGGVSREFVLSRDGHWAMASAAASEQPAVVFVRLQ